MQSCNPKNITGQLSVPLRPPDSRPAGKGRTLSTRSEFAAYSSRYSVTRVFGGWGGSGAAAGAGSDGEAASEGEGGPDSNVESGVGAGAGVGGKRRSAVSSAASCLSLALEFLIAHRMKYSAMGRSRGAVSDGGAWRPKERSRTSVSLSVAPGWSWRPREVSAVRSRVRGREVGNARVIRGVHCHTAGWRPSSLSVS